MGTTEAPVSDLYPMHAGRDSGHLGMSAELFTARYFQHAAHVRGTGYDDPLLDWRLIQDAEANAWEIATHARGPARQPPESRIPGGRDGERPWPADRCGRARAGKPRQIPPCCRAGQPGATPPRRPAVTAVHNRGGGS